MTSCQQTTVCISQDNRFVDLQMESVEAGSRQLAELLRLALKICSAMCGDATWTAVGLVRKVGMRDRVLYCTGRPRWCRHGLRPRRAVTFRPFPGTNRPYLPQTTARSLVPRPRESHGDTASLSQ